MAEIKQDVLKKAGPLDIVRDRWIYIGLSLLMLVPGAYYMVANTIDPAIGAPVRLGIDFTGGSMLEIGFHKPVSEEQIPDVKAVFDHHGYHGTIVQIQKPRSGVNDEAAQAAAASKSADIKTETAKTETTKTETAAAAAKPATAKAEPAKAAPDNKTADKASAAQVAGKSGQGGNVATIVYIRSKQLSSADRESIHRELTEKLGENTLLQSFSVGPSLASELLKNGLMALALAYVLIVGYLTFRFEFDYAICAIVSLVHDALFVFGIFAILGHFFHTEIDSMFITSILTVVGFSVHDTIVVYDRLRENSRLYYSKLNFSEIANLSVNQTLARSLSTSFTVLLTLLALYFFGGDTTKDFVLACIIGITIGCYSSIFVSSALLAWWRERNGTGRKRSVSAATVA